MTQSNVGPGWYPDPTGGFELRYWDGAGWTDHVSSGGQNWTSPMPGVSQTQVHVSSPERVAHQVQTRAGITPSVASTSGHLLDQPVLVVNQKAKLIELTNEYAVYDQNGNQLGSVIQVGQNALKKALRLVSSVDQFMTHKLEVRDISGAVILTLTRPAKVFKSTVVVGAANGAEIGRIVQENMIGKIRFGLMYGNARVGSINAENWRAWNFSIKDETETEVARITKTWEGLAKTMFTTADNYVIQMHRQLQEPLRSLVVASALTVDTALKQDSRGFG
ncbi:MAG TPA: phospholipid scramblase-related protein [Actinomycetota bacterium]|nr:phospholipid scramblase-related protein [Actinomycetota bacterium]